MRCQAVTAVAQQLVLYPCSPRSQGTSQQAEEGEVEPDRLKRGVRGKGVGLKGNTAGFKFFTRGLEEGMEASRGLFT